MKKYDVIIIGAGAAGLMCAIEAAKRGKSTLILDKANKVAKKILISGGGRCNFTNIYTDASAYLSNNPHFCKSALSRYSPWDFIQLFEQHGLTWTEKTLGQLFCDQKSKAVVQLLLDECQQYGVTIQLDSQNIRLNKTTLFHLHTETDSFDATSVVIATGGASIPRMGATDFALQIAKQFGLKNIPFRAALVPLIFSQADMAAYFAGLSGLAFEADVSCGNRSFREAVLITHKGLSGPAILQISSYWHKGKPIVINLFPDKDVSNWLEQQKTQHPKTHLVTVLAWKIPKRLAKKLCEGVLGNPILEQINALQWQTLIEQLTTWTLYPQSTEGMRTAEVCLGGVNTDELSSKTFATKKVEGLFFIGESIDVTGHLGGYNFQWAWASAWCAGHYV